MQQGPRDQPSCSGTVSPQESGVQVSGIEVSGTQARTLSATTGCSTGSEDTGSGSPRALEQQHQGSPPPAWAMGSKTERGHSGGPLTWKVRRTSEPSTLPASQPSRSAHRRSRCAEPVGHPSPPSPEKAWGGAPLTLASL